MMMNETKELVNEINQLTDKISEIIIDESHFTIITSFMSILMAIHAASNKEQRLAIIEIIHVTIEQLRKIESMHHEKTH